MNRITLTLISILFLVFSEFTSSAQDKVGIGTQTPSAQFHTTGTVRFQGITYDNTQNNLLVGDNSGNLFIRAVSSLPTWFTNGNSGTNPTNNFLGTTDNTRMVFRTNNTERVTILGNGNTGFGTSGPESLLHIQNNSLDNNLFLTGMAPSLRLFQGDWNNSSIRGRLGLATSFAHFVTTSSPGDLILQAVSENGSLIFGTNETVPFAGNGIERMRINNIGYVGINVSTPTAKLHINCSLTLGQNNPSNIRFENLQSGIGSVLVIDANGYIYKSSLSVSQNQASSAETEKLKAEVEQLKKQLGDILEMIKSKAQENRLN